MNYSYIKVPSPIQDVLSNKTLIIMADKFSVNITVRAHGAKGSSRRSNVKPERETHRREKAEERVEKRPAPSEEDNTTKETLGEWIQEIEELQKGFLPIPRVDTDDDSTEDKTPPQDTCFNSLNEAVKSRIEMESIHNIDDYLEAVKAAVREIKAEEKAKTKTDSKLKRFSKTIKKKVTGAWDSVFGGKKGNCNPKNDSVETE